MILIIKNFYIYIIKKKKWNMPINRIYKYATRSLNINIIGWIFSVASDMDNEEKARIDLLESNIKAELNDLKNKILKIGSEGKEIKVTDPNNLTVRIRIKDGDLAYSFKYGGEWEEYKPYDSIYWVEDDFQIDMILRNQKKLLEEL